MACLETSCLELHLHLQNNVLSCRSKSLPSPTPHSTYVTKVLTRAVDKLISCWSFSLTAMSTIVNRWPRSFPVNGHVQLYVADVFHSSLDYKIKIFRKEGTHKLTSYSQGCSNFFMYMYILLYNPTLTKEWGLGVDGWGMQAKNKYYHKINTKWTCQVVE